MFKKLLLVSLITLSTLLADAQSVNFLGATKREAKKELRHMGFKLDTKNPIFSRATAIHAYNNDVGAYGLYIFVGNKCVEFMYSIDGSDEYDWQDFFEDAGLTELQENTYVNTEVRQIFTIYPDTADECIVYVTTY
jgi:hypothetical protein